MRGKYKAAPPEEMVRYLAILRRGLVSIAYHGNQNNVKGFQFASNVADALHNVPGMLFHWDRNYQTASRLGPWVSEGFPAQLKQGWSPSTQVEEAVAIGRLTGGAIELGLSDDLQDVVIAPQTYLVYYLELLYQYMLHARVSLRSEALPERFRMPWRKQKPEIVTRLNERCQSAGEIAEWLSEIPAALVKWPQFDESDFLKRADVLMRRLPHWEAQWLQFLLEPDSDSAL